MASRSFTERISWSSTPTAPAYLGHGSLADTAFTVSLYANGNPSSSAYTIIVRAGDHVERRSAHVGGISAAKRRMRDVIREAVATARGDSFPGFNGE